MNRCFELALLAGNSVKSNPNVGAVLVYNNRIIAESFHKFYGGNHAEKNAILSVCDEDKQYIKDSCLYVSLEPCNIHSKTPPCSDLILKEGIKKIVIGTEDPNPEMQGKSLDYLRSKGVEVISNVLQENAKRLIAPFRANLSNRPYVILKYAQSSDNYIGKKNKSVWLSNDILKFKSHIWRSEIDGILVGYQTALIDNPQLTNRLVPGNNPIRVVVDRNLSLPKTHHLWSDPFKTIFVTSNEAQQSNDSSEVKTVISLNFDDKLYSAICTVLYERGINKLMVEGGAKTIKSFIENALWDEARVIKTDISLKSGITAPNIDKPIDKLDKFLNNTVQYYFNR